MKIIYPLVELWDDLNGQVESHVARCARVCYGKEDGDNKRTYNNLIKRGHLSMLRHATRYFIIPYDKANEYIRDLCFIRNTNIIAGFDCDFISNVNYKKFVIVVNGQWCYEHPTFVEENKQYERTKDQIIDCFGENYNLLRYTFKVTTQISTSRELNRVSPNNIAERSTRYVYEDGTICKPHWMTDDEVNLYNNGKTFDLKESTITYLRSCAHSFKNYKELVNNDMRRQDARGVLPLDTATVCIYTYTAKEWSDILDLRYYGKTGAPHPNAKEVANMIRLKLNTLGYDFPD